MLSLSLNKILKVGLVVSTVSISVCALAAEKLKVSGFIGLGYATTSDNNFLGDGKSSNPLIELGLSASYQFSNNLSFTGQIGQRRLGESFNDENPRVDFASVNYFSNTLGMGEQSISLGRVKVPSGFYNASRDVPSTRPSILLPQSVYPDIFRNTQLSVDGLLVNTTNDLFGGTLFINASLGRPQIDDNFNLAMFGKKAKGSWDIDLSKSLNMAFDNDAMSLGMTFTRLTPEYSAQPNDAIVVIPDVFEIPIVDGDIFLQTFMLSARFYIGELEWTNEYMYRKIIVDGYVPGRGETARPQEGYYTQIRYPFSENLSAFARWERFYRNADDKTQQRTRPVDVPLWVEITTSKSIGVSYQLSRNWQVSAEIHDVNGSAWLPAFFIATPEASESKDWTFAAFQLAYRF